MYREQSVAYTSVLIVSNSSWFDSLIKNAFASVLNN
jgi:hypothetical protein